MRIGARDLVTTQTLILPDEETAEFTADIHGWKFRMLITFHPEAEGERLIRREVQKDHVHWHFDKWVANLGIALKEPEEVARLKDGRVVSVLLFHHRVGNMNCLHIQVMLGGADGK